MSENKFEWSDKTIKELFEYVFPLTSTPPHDFQKWIDHFKKSKCFATPIEKDYKVVFGGSNYITTVCRPSDNQKYSVGDFAEVKDNNGGLTKFYIRRFDLTDNGDLMVSMVGSGGRFNLSLLEPKAPKKKILGTTHDGKVCYEGDTFPLWMVWPKESFELHQITSWLCLWDIERVYFFDKSKALQYIQEHKPIQVSYKELDSIIKYLANSKDYETVEGVLCEIKEFFKSKIQQA